MNYRSLLVIAPVAGLVVGLAFFGVFYTLSDAFIAQADLAAAGIHLYRGPAGLVLVLGLAIGWLATASCAKFSGYAGLTLLPPLLLFLGAVALTIVGLGQESLPGATHALNPVATFTTLAIGVSASTFEWLNL